MNQVITAPTTPRITLFLIAVLRSLRDAGCVGLYGVVSYTAAQRTSEIEFAWRSEQLSDVLKMVVGQGMMLAVIECSSVAASPC
jgi:hypothetical protein